MSDYKEITIKLREFISADKFEVYQHLQPAVEASTPEVKQYINNEINKCASEVLVAAEKSESNPDVYRAIVAASFDRIEDVDLDTEDREFCYALYDEVGMILGLNQEQNSEDVGQQLAKNLEALLKKSGIDLNKFMPPDSSATK